MNITCELKHGVGNPRNSEGSFVKLRDGAILFAYSRYNGSSDHFYDHDSADLYKMISRDNGRTWSKPELMIKNTAQNVMSVSFLRLQDGRIALLHTQKTALKAMSDVIDCRSLFRTSDDEGKTWSDPVDIAGLPLAYNVTNNDRLVQLKSGRLVVPTAFHRFIKGGNISICPPDVFYLSDDGGKTWRESKQMIFPPSTDIASGLQEPGVIELNDGRVMMWARTSAGCQYKAYSYDGCETWTQALPAPEFLGPCSPLSMKRNPLDGSLLAVWNDYAPWNSVKPVEGSGGRTPLTAARSTDDGRTWTQYCNIETEQDHGYCYTAIEFNGDEVLLAYCCAGGKDLILQDSRIRVCNWYEMFPLAAEEKNGRIAVLDAGGKKE